MLRSLTFYHSHTRFSRIQDVQPISSSFSSLEELRLNQTLIVWPEILALLPILPSLIYLELGCNSLKTLDTSATEKVQCRSKIESLNFDENRLEDWGNVMTAIAEHPR